MNNPRTSEKGHFQAKKERDPNCSIQFPNNIITPSSSSSSRQWSIYKNPRIVRVSRTFGGKDRHSKVCTVRGLRDRRIRLSVPTAIELYDLQDRLGLSQPSKVVDWLIDATKHEIDKLPPLPMLPMNQLSHHQVNPQSHFLNSTHPNKELGHNQREKDKWIIDHQQENNQDQGFGGLNYQLFPLGNNSIFPNMPYNSYNFHWDPQNLSLSQFGGGYPFPVNQLTEDNQSHNILASSSQLYFCPPATNIPSIIPSFITPSMDNDQLREINNHVQQNPILPTTLHLISSPMKSFMLNLNPKTVTSQGNDHAARQDKDS